MKKIILAAAAASMLATPALAAPRHDNHQREPQRATVVHQAPQRTAVDRTVRRTPAVQHRTWQRGQRFDARNARNYREVDYRRYRGLQAPPRGYHWVQSGNDAVLVSIASGLIGAVIGGAIFN
ncbi:RcnB family protein [Stakelama saccharophila]|uniref:RcnB family protein n=1 Tax=Stakelama saccharophila TaxID=3075605 RepID=A0ABZ0B541_9SPHN|nr:RcnB family protein [Stakelama sp. W311]WNO52444.1 RcnB family protein [Stakelama sp. W311]